MTFWLGTHQPAWLAKPDAPPLFVSAIRLRRRKSPWGQASGEWALDSGGFSELTQHGRWTVGPQQYADEVRRWRDEMGGGLMWAAIQDWMCEPFVLKKTAAAEGIITPIVPAPPAEVIAIAGAMGELYGPGYEVTVSPADGPILPELTRDQVAERIAAHQRRTIQSWRDLTRIAPEVPWVPVLQGWRYDDYLSHVEQYRAAGVDLAALPLVGLGSVCRRQHTAMAEELIRELHGRGIRVHGFGFKLDGLRRCSRWPASADSLAWSFQARRVWRGAGRRCCDTRHKGGCANCYPWAVKWRGQVLTAVATGERAVRVPTLFDVALTGA